MTAKRNMKFLDLHFHLCGYLVRSKRSESEFLDKFNDFDSQFKDFALGKENSKPPSQLDMFYIPLVSATRLIIEKYKDFSNSCLIKANEIFTNKPKEIQGLSIITF